MIVKRGDGDYARVYRPHRVSEVYGQETIKMLTAKGLDDGSLSKTLLFLGVSGTGKTTMGRIIAMGLNCEKGRTSEPCGVCESCRQVIDGNHLAFQEINAADLSGVDKMRDLRGTLDSMPLGNFQKKIVLFDECHRLSKEAQTLLLRVVEDAKSHLQFIFCSTEKEPVIETLRYRCLQLEFEPLLPNIILELLQDVCRWEVIRYKDTVLKRIAEDSKGMARNALFLLQKAVGNGKLEKIGRKSSVEIIERHKVSGFLVVAPHGVYHDDDYTGTVARELADSLDCHAVINEKYQKPETVGFDHTDLERGLVNLNRLDQIQGSKEIQDEFLDPIERLKQRIGNEKGRGLIIHIHGISDENLQAVEEVISGSSGNPLGFDILIGYGQSVNGKNPLTAKEKALVEPLIDHLKQVGINAAVAPTTPIISGESYCGNDNNGLNKYFSDPTIGIQSIQLEIQKSKFRETVETATLAGKSLSQGLYSLSVQNPLSGITISSKAVSDEDLETPKSSQTVGTAYEKSSWSTLTKKPKMKEIKVGEIDLNDTKFMFRATDLGVDQERLDWLVSTIRSGRIHQNIIVRRVPDKDGFQLISGFRRISALQRICEEDDRKDTIKEEKVWAEIYDSLTDEQAFQVSLSENLAREDLSVWEMANSFRTIKAELLKGGKRRGEIEKHLGIMTNKEPRTLRRFLQISAIENQDIRRDIHNGDINFSTATIFAREDFSEDDRAALYRFYKNQKMPFLKFEKCTKTLLKLRGWSEMSLAAILELSDIKDLLSLDSRELRERLEELRKKGGGNVEQVLKDFAVEFKKFNGGANLRTQYDYFLENFSQKSAPIEKKVNDLLAVNKVPASFSLKPSKDYDSKAINLSISSPIKDAQRALHLVSVNLETSLSSLESAFKHLPKQQEVNPKKAKTSGTREWAVYSVNCCNGCSHDCVYCYGKFMANRRVKGHIPLDKWKEEEVRQKDVAKGYRKREGRIMFPSAHDITPSNFKACYTVLEKLLEAGNEVLVVSKPHFECIKPICDGLVRFKDSILFRFTIGAKNDGILSIWEPNAPSYEERKRCLKYAFDSGYNTSVSVEPMLDSENIDSLVKDLMPFVSDAIWVGKMNHIGRIISNNGDLKEEIRKIKESQSDDKIKAIYERHKENPKIKWKESIKKVVGIAPVEKPGMDI